MGKHLIFTRNFMFFQEGVQSSRHDTTLEIFSSKNPFWTQKNEIKDIQPYNKYNEILCQMQ